MNRGELYIGSPEGEEYMKKHDHAVEWARANRDLISLRFLQALQGQGEFSTNFLCLFHEISERHTKLCVEISLKILQEKKTPRL
jgi:RNA-splicing ligase RtcB